MHAIEEYQDPYYPDRKGLQLVADGHVQAVIIDYPTRSDLIFQVRGPLDLDQSREVITGLLDLLVHHDQRGQKRSKR